MYALLIVIPALFTGNSLRAQDDAIGKFFGKYIEDSRFTLVSVSPKMFRLLAKVSWDSIPPDLRGTVQKLHSLRILSTESTPMQFYKEAISKIDLKQYEELITVRDKHSDTRFLTKESGGIITELLMISVDDGDFTLMSFVGEIDLDKLSRLSAKLSIKGMENLKDVKKKK
jgi:hypothetical protein